MKIHELISLLKEAETHSDGKISCKGEVVKDTERRKRNYSKCYGPAFIMQFSGSGLVAPVECCLIVNIKNTI